MKSYAVVFTYSFDSDVAVYLFDTEEEAKAYLLGCLHEEMRIQTEENCWDSEYTLTNDGWEATIISHMRFGDDVMKIRIGRVYS